MRVALIAPLWAPVRPGTCGGVEAVVHLLAEQLAREGHEVTLFASGDSVVSGRLHSVHPLNMITAMERGETAEYEYYSECSVAEALQQRHEYDVLHFHLGPISIPIAAICEAASVHTSHNPLTPDAVWLLERYPRATATAVARHQVAKVACWRRQSIHIVQNGCDFNAYDFSDSPGRYLAFLGRMSPDKGPLEAIEIAKLAGIPIVLAGRPLNREEEEYFEAWIRPKIDGASVQWIGSVDHAAKNSFLKNAAALLFPIQWDEPFGMVMIEAMACGTPVIAMNRNAVPDIAEYGVSGFYGRSVGELAEFVPLALSLDRNGVRRSGSSRFSVEAMAAGYLAVYEQATAAVS